MIYAQVLLGFVLLFGGGEALVRGAVSLARRLGVSPLVIGLTLVGFGTSTPELAAGIDAALIGAPGIVVGSILGSNIANSLLILGLTALIAPIICEPRAFKRDGSILAAITIAFIAVLLWSDTAGAAIGGAFVAALAGYVIWTYFQDRRANDEPAKLHAQEAELVRSGGLHPLFAVALVLAGMAAIVFGAKFLVDGAVAVASEFGVSETVIGLTVVAIGTSLPELATCALAARKGEGDIALGNVIGSNIFNVLGVFGVTTLIEPITIPMDVDALDIAVFGGSTLMILVFAITGWRFHRIEGAICLAAYVAFVSFLALGPL